MRIRRVEINRWRNLERVDLQIAPESGFLCLVGENGTGKTQLLEVINFAAHHLGLIDQPTGKRQMLGGPHSHDFEIRVVLDVSDVLTDREGMVSPEYQPLLDQWDGTLTFHLWGGPKEATEPPPPAQVHYVSAGSGETFYFYMGFVANGVEDQSRAHAMGHQITGRLREADQVLHLFIDAERVFPSVDVADHEVLAKAREDMTAPAWFRQQASVVTQNLYLEWMRAMLGQQQRAQSAYWQQAQEADRAGTPIPSPSDFLDHYRKALKRVLPHLEFVRLDQDKRRLIYNSAGAELPYEELSGGERELAFLVGQIERFGMQKGLFLLDEPELHLNTELLRGWLEYLKSAVDTGQVWIATHSLEAAEVAGLDATLVFERGDTRTVGSVEPLGNRPALATLAGHLGSPAFSLARSRFIFIEGERPRRERERFIRLLDTPPSDRFLEGGGCQQVLAKLQVVRELASEAEQLRVGAFIDRDFRTEAEVQTLEQSGVSVLPVHEIENFFLEPTALEEIARQAGMEASEAFDAVRDASDRQAGRWILERTAHREGWEVDLGPAQGVARRLSWEHIAGDPTTALQPVVDAIAGLSALDSARYRAALAASATAYDQIRERTDELWKQCFGKEVLREVPERLGIATAEALEDRVMQLWRTSAVARPAEVQVLRDYLAGIPVLR